MALCCGPTRVIALSRPSTASKLAGAHSADLDPRFVDGMVYWGSGYAILGTTPGNALLAFGIESPPGPEQPGN